MLSEAKKNFPEGAQRLREPFGMARASTQFDGFAVGADRGVEVSLLQFDMRD